MGLLCYATIMFDINTVPKIRIREGISGNAEIKKNRKTYTLFVNNEKWMMAQTNSTQEIREFYSSYDLAYGSVLLSGFGFGILPQWIASKPSVTKVTVIEWSKDVVNLYLKNNKLDDKISIVISDIHSYKDKENYDWAILDHYESFKVPTPEELYLIEKNINFSNLWFWSIERFAEKYPSWDELRKKYSFKLPEVSEDKLEYYKEISRYKVIPHPYQ